MQPPPQNPYSGFPSPNDPIPPYGGGNPGGVPPRGPEISFDAISQAWTVFQSGMGTYIGAAVVLILFSAVFQGLQTALTPRGSNEFSALPLFVGLIGGLVNQFFGAGFLRMAINHLKTGHVDFGDMLSVGDVYLNIIIAAILVGIATTLGICFCIIPGLLLSGLFMFVNPLIVDRKMSAIDAMTASFNTLKPQMWMAMLFIIVVGMVVFLGICACFVGLLVTIPVGVLSVAITYRNFFGANGGGLIIGETGPVAPIADPRF
ncbi:hypothetical protein EON80_00690 [bacterium]|nr:MAG: hypothetical protein EON80_00690 [bacterium]